MKITILGAGSWGSTLAVLLYEKGYQVTIWEFDPAQALKLKEKRELSFFPGLTLEQDILVTSDLNEAIGGSDLVINAVPSNACRDVAGRLPNILKKGSIIVNASKGLERGTFFRISQVFASEIGEDILDRFVVLSGPSHAEEVSRKIPTAVVLASRNSSILPKIQDIFLTPYFRTYINTDVTGVELGGSLKNIIAIAGGISDGLGFGDNAKAALITRGLVEVARLSMACGSDPHTLFGLSGLGDLVVTCTSRHSRNRALGEKIGKGISLKKAQDEVFMVAEGVYTTEAAFQLSRQLNISMPITEQIYEILFNSKKPLNAFSELMDRPLRTEKEDIFYNDAY